MPLLLVCGYPSSGKSRISNDVSNLLQTNGYDCLVLSDRESGYTPNMLYDVAAEKTVRARLIGNVERNLNKTTTIVVDSSNEVKGYRYQMYCLSRSVSTNHMVIHLDSSVEECKNWNSVRNESDKYPLEIFEEMIRRFESPNPHARWDNPLIKIRPDDPIPIEDIIKTLYKIQRPGQSLATIPRRQVDQDYSVKLDHELVCVLNEVYETQNNGHYLLGKPLSMTDGQRYKRQFIAMNRTTPLDHSQIRKSFVHYMSQMINSTV